VKGLLLLKLTGAAVEGRLEEDVAGVEVDFAVGEL